MNRLLRGIGGCVLLAGLMARGAHGQDGNDLGALPVARPFQAGVGFPAPGKVWIGGNAAHNGLGYQGSYFTGGVVTNLGDDLLEGFWVFDGRAHISQQGNLLGNFGFVRGLTLEQLAADFRMGIFYDIDGDKFDNFGHTFHQIGVTGEVLNDFFEVRANGYFPIATPTHQLGTPENCFVGNNFLIQTGLDAALTGFDTRLGFRPAALQPWAGVIDVGGYYYRSDVVEPFGGFTGGFNIQPVSGVNTIFQINHDDQFKTTGLLAVQIHFGGSRGRGASRYSREAEPVRRNDHIVRVHRDPIFALNPATGALWNVIHVDNSVAAGGDGTAERPFNNLTAAQNASVVNDMIFVREGLTPGNLTGMNTGIVLKDNQFFLGDGVSHLVPTQLGLFQLCTDLDGVRPTITNPIGPAVTLANNNTVAGFVIGNAVNPALVGIQGIGTNNTNVQDNRIANSLSDGIRITNGTGNLNFTRNTIVNSLADGLRIVNSDGTVNVSDSTFDNNTNGVHIDKTAGAPLDVNITTSTFTNNLRGVLSEVTGLAAVLNTNVTNNLDFSDNTLAGIEVRSTGGAVHTVVIDGNLSIDGNGRGVIVQAFDGGLNTSLISANITNNVFTDNIGGGAGQGSHIFVNVDGNARTPNITIDNNLFTGGSLIGGVGVQFTYNSTTNTPPDNLVTLSNNVFNNIDNDGAVAFSVFGATRLGALIDRNLIQGATGAIDGVLMLGAGTSQTHFRFTGNAITGFDQDGIHAAVLGGGGPTMVVEATGNQLIAGNGANGIILELGQFAGIPVANTNAQLFGLLQNNVFSPNLGPDDVTVIIQATALVTSEICLQMVSNDASNGIQLTNNSVAATFNFEDGGNSGTVTTAGAGTVTPVAAGTCAAAAAPFTILP